MVKVHGKLSHYILMLSLKKHLCISDYIFEIETFKRKFCWWHFNGPSKYKKWAKKVLSVPIAQGSVHPTFCMWRIDLILLIDAKWSPVRTARRGFSFLMSVIVIYLEQFFLTRAPPNKVSCYGYDLWIWFEYFLNQMKWKTRESVSQWRRIHLPVILSSNQSLIFKMLK